MSEAEAKEVSNKMEPYSPPTNAEDITPNKDGGVLKELKKEGEENEKPYIGDKVEVHYVGYLPDGTIFDSSRDRNKHFIFTLGKGEVIKAWDLGIASMKKGELAVLYCQPEYAYGPGGSPPKIPPNATLVFEVELISWMGEDLSEDKDGGIIRRVIDQGDGNSTPNGGAEIEVTLVGRYNKQVFEERTIKFALGEGAEHGIVSGVETALEKFNKGERSSLILKPDYAFGKAGKPEFNIPPNANVEYEVTLVNFEKAKESWEMDSAEKLEQAKICKEKGTKYFKEGKFDSAEKYYRKVIDYLEYSQGFSDEQEKESKQLQLAAYLNQAMCALKSNKHFEARGYCEKALEIDPLNEKGLFRRGTALCGMKEFELSKKDFEEVVKLDPNNKAAANQVIVCNMKIKDQKDTEKRLYANMFQKFADQDTKKENFLRAQMGDVLENPGVWGDNVDGGKNNELNELTSEQKEELEAQVSMITP